MSDNLLLICWSGTFVLASKPMLLSMSVNAKDTG